MERKLSTLALPYLPKTSFPSLLSQSGKQLLATGFPCGQERRQGTLWGHQVEGSLG